MRSLLVVFGCLIAGALDAAALDFPGNVSCHSDEIQIWLPEEFGNSSSWEVGIVDASGEPVESCDYDVDYDKQMVTAPLANCTKAEHNKHRLRLQLQPGNATSSVPEDQVYEIDCDTAQADEAVLPASFISATNCTRDFMAVAFPKLFSSPGDQIEQSWMEWVVSIEEGAKIVKLSLKQAVEQGYTFRIDGNHIVFQAPFHAMGIVAYKQDSQVLYTLTFRLTYGPPDQQLTAESRMICTPEPATCNGTHMIVTIPAFPGTLATISLDNRQVLPNQQQPVGISVDTRNGVKLYISKRVLKSKLSPTGDCSGFQSYISALKLDFDYQGETASMLTHLECPCEQNAPIVALCTQDGHMSFEVDSSSTKPTLNLDSLRLRDPACKPTFRSPSNDVVRFYVPLNSCGTKQRFDGEKMVYENEVNALWMNLPPRLISRDSEFRLTVICSYGNDDASLNVKIKSFPSPGAVINQGPLTLLLLIYPDESYSIPYNDDQYPIVKYLQQPIFLEVQVLNRNDPNIYLMLDDCWATMSLDPSSLPRWNIVVDGCNYDLDNYRTVFHPAGPSVSYANFRQRFEVKAFAFVSGGKALPSKVFFHCSVIICNRFQPDSPLCSSQCPQLLRSKRDVDSVDNTAMVTLPHPVILVPEEMPAGGQQERTRNEGIWITATLTVGVILGLAAITLGLLALFKFQKKIVLIN